jgi:SHS family lactate transporter-like MFS transporter
MQASFAVSHDNNYALALAVVAGTASVVIAIFILFSRERRGMDMTRSAEQMATSPV